MIPKELDEFLDYHKVSDYSIVENNKNKGRYCISYEKDNTKFFLKYNDKEADHLKHWKKLKYEQLIYSMLGESHLLSVFTDDKYKDFLITEYVDGVTFRTKMKELYSNEEYDALVDCIRDVFVCWNQSIHTFNTPDNRKTIKKNQVSSKASKSVFEIYLRSLYCSGPHGTQINRAELYRNRLLLALKKRSISRELLKRLNLTEAESVPYIHGDFHANNVLIGNSEKVTILDYENVCKGYPEVELAYMYAQCALLFRNKRSVRKKTDRIIDELGEIKDKELFWTVFKLYFEAVRKNHRFY